MRPIGKLTEKHEIAVKMRSNGATQAEIGRALGLSGSQARILLRQAFGAELRQDECPSHRAVDFIGVRARNCLAMAGIDIMSSDAAQAVAAIPEKEMLKWPNFGRGSLSQVEAWLKFNGLQINRPAPQQSKPRAQCPHCGEIL